jgi:phasin
MAGKQGTTTGNADDTGVPENVRQAAESTIAQARQAVDQYMREATRLYGAMESSVQVAQAGSRDVSRTAIGFAEENVSAALDFAQQLVRAETPQEIAALQQTFLKQQFERMKTQMQEIGDAGMRAVGEVSAAARPKTPKT